MPDAPQPSPAGILASLLAAMRDAAEQIRASSLASLRAEADRLLEELRARSGSATEDEQRRASAEAQAIAAWRDTEIQRIRSEAEQRIEQRRLHHEREQVERRAGIEREVTRIQAAVAEYERALAGFFADLEQVEDPAAFVAAAERIPAPPQLGAVTALATPAEPAAERPPLPLNTVVTLIAVAGHDSFGAVTSVKQALEQVRGVSSVALGLGETGEFVLTAEHDPALDVPSALSALGLRGVRIDADDGRLRVALGPTH